ncbi:MAG: hypothetical protein HRT44_12880 [Bdellovibrionales bacterium]|nr:hypothetical protein [Bdellovibrionales bacterium]
MIRSCEQSVFPLVAQAAAEYQSRLFQIDLGRSDMRRRQREEYEAAQEVAN